MTKKEMQEKRARLATQMRAMVEAVKKDDRGFNTEERSSWNTMTDEVNSLDSLIEAEAAVTKIETSLGALNETEIAPAFAEVAASRAGRTARVDNSPHMQAFKKWMRGGMEALEGDERKLMSSRFLSNSEGIRNAQTITTTGGGYLVPRGFSNQLEEALKFYGGILGEVNVFMTETGQPLPWPTDNDTENMGRILAINTQVIEADITFGEATFNAYTGSSDIILVPLALIEDSYFDMNAYVARKLGTRLGRQVTYYGTVGTGSNQPTGLSTAVIAAGNTVQGATGETTSIVYNDLVNLVHLVDPAYRNSPSCKFMFADSSLKVLRKLVDGNNRPLWQPGINAGFGNNSPETILDKPYVINQAMPTMAASAYPLLFGDLSKFNVRIVAAGGGDVTDNAGKVASGVTMMRLVERYADYLQVGFTGFLRYDSNLIDAGTHPVAAWQNSAS
ncbi:phage major capsid protein [Telmatobacter bradus]|uniref:phage major capsid protein n=1 Tax=Telmatobacter bradus TaxID=474953 RepID=UPI003B42899C